MYSFMASFVSGYFLSVIMIKKKKKKKKIYQLLRPKHGLDWWCVTFHQQWQSVPVHFILFETGRFCLILWGLILKFEGCGHCFSPSLIVARLVNFQDGRLMAMWHHVLGTWCRLLHKIKKIKKKKK